MAKTPAKTTKSGTAVAKKDDAAKAAAAEFLKNSMGNADADSFAIPFLTILQANSPQCDPQDGAYIEGAQRGMILDTVTQEMFTTLEVFPVYFKREFIEWVLREKGGGIVARYLPEDAPEYKERDVSGKRLWMVEGSDTNQLVDTRQHYVMFRPIEGDGHWKPAMIGMTSTQLKKSKRLMTMLKEQRKAGNLLTFKFGTVGESNDKGSWSGWTIAPLSDAMEDAGLLEEANEFQLALREDRVQVAGEEAMASQDTEETGDSF